jgi:teichuronic acid biosynthesis glycosyltransferase TuaG
MLLFSIVTPVLNGSIYIARYLNSLQSQEYVNWEAIIIDDGSSDGTYEELLSIAKDDSRIKCAKRNNRKIVQSPYAARNQGLSCVKGDYVLFLDIDDFWLPTFLSDYNMRLEQDGAIHLLYSNYYRYKAGDDSLHLRQVHYFRPTTFWCQFFNPVPMLTACVRTEVIKQMGIQFEPVNHEDYRFWLKLIRNIDEKNIYCNEAPLSVYIQRPLSLSSNKLRAFLWTIDCHRKGDRLYNWKLPIRMIFFIFVQTIFIVSSTFRSNMVPASLKSQIQVMLEI